MESSAKPFVHLSIDAVDAVAHDPEGLLDAARFDRYPTFVQARDAALSSIEAMLHEADYDDEDHREELERMLGLLEPASSFEDLVSRPEYRSFLSRLTPAEPVAA